MTMPRLVLALACTASLARPAFAQAPVTATDLAQVRLASAIEGVAPAGDARVTLGELSQATASAPRHGVFPDLFTPLGSDFKHLATRDTALWLALGAGAALAVHPADRHFTSTLSSTTGVEDALDPGSPIGSGYVQVGAALGTYVVGRMAGTSQLAHVGADLFRAQVVNTALTQGIKLAARRTRPDGSSDSFPSGHASSAFATATVLQRHYGWKVGLPAYALAAYVGGSRMAENRHYLSDVLFGAALGVVAGHAVTFGHGAHRFALTPMAVPGGAGIGFVHIRQ